MAGGGRELKQGSSLNFSTTTNVFCEGGSRQASWLLPAATNCHTCVNNIPTDDGGGKRGMEKGGAGDDNDDDDDD